MKVGHGADGIFATVAICTWNRARLLEQTLTSLTKLKIPAGTTWELIVVNNNSSDDTDAVIDSFKVRLPIVHLTEKTPGLSNARNRAMASARGELVVWTDDDTCVDPEWLLHHVEGARRWPDAVYFGGRIVPMFSGEPPAWVVKNPLIMDRVLVNTDFGLAERRFRLGENPVGANMSFRVPLPGNFKFDPELGRKQKGLMGGEERSLFQILNNQGRVGVWLPKAVVHHHTEDERLTEAFIRKFFEQLGVTNVALGEYGRYQFLADLPKGLGCWTLRGLLLVLTARTLVLKLLRHDRWISAVARSEQLRGALRARRCR